MAQISWFLHMMMFLSSVSLINSQSPDKEPFIFDPYTLQIYDSEDYAKSDAEHKFVFACPAEDNDEEQFVIFVSERYQSVFIKNYIEKKLQDDSPIKCKAYFQLSLVYRTSSKFIEFGYEVYYPKSKYPNENFTTDNIYDFGFVTEVDSRILRWTKSIQDYSLDPSDPRKRRMRSWSIIWIPEISVEFNAPTWMFKTMEYTIHPIKEKQLTVKCDRFNFGNIVYNSNTRLDDLYKSENQEKYFSQVQLQTIPGPSCKSHYECVQKYNLIMPYHFQAHPSNKVLCSDLTSVPLWHNIPKALLDQLEIFLIAISQVTGHQLVIQPGVHEILSLPSTTSNQQQKMYLDPNKKRVPIPRHIYKVAQYNSHDCDERNILCWFSMVIVIHNHNQIEINETDKLCPKDKCHEFGFDRIQYLSTGDENGTK